MRIILVVTLLFSAVAVVEADRRGMGLPAGQPAPMKHKSLEHFPVGWGLEMPESMDEECEHDDDKLTCQVEQVMKVVKTQRRAIEENLAKAKEIITQKEEIDEIVESLDHMLE